jgi:hypothetical protein
LLMAISCSELGCRPSVLAKATAAFFIFLRASIASEREAFRFVEPWRMFMASRTSTAAFC